MPARKRTYLDHAASTPVDPRVLAAMQPFFTAHFGNPSAIHTDGVSARAAVDTARSSIARIISAHPDEIVFTSGGTEGNTMAILGVMDAAPAGSHAVVSSFEHHSVLRAFEAAARAGHSVTYVPPRADGIVDPRDIKKALKPNTVLVSVMYANNEVGTIQSIAEIAKTVRRFRAGGAYPLLHTDACQAAGNIPIDCSRLGADLLVLNAHKIYGPKGVGLLWVKRGIELSPRLFGGGQERGMRSGTENVPGIVGLASALLIADQMREVESVRQAALRDFIIKTILVDIPQTELNGHPLHRLSGNVNISFLGVDSEQLVIELDVRGFSVSSGAACARHDLESSYVILSLGKGAAHADSALRISIGRKTQKKDVDRFLAALSTVVAKLRRFSK